MILCGFTERSAFLDDEMVNCCTWEFEKKAHIKVEIKLFFCLHSL